MDLVGVMVVVRMVVFVLFVLSMFNVLGISVFLDVRVGSSVFFLLRYHGFP